jgi:hypothetical protein
MKRIMRPPEVEFANGEKYGLVVTQGVWCCQLRRRLACCK